MAKFAFSTIRQFLRSSKGIRASREAVELMQKHLEEHAEVIAKEAAELARHAGRKTILAEDIKLAIKRKG